MAFLHKHGYVHRDLKAENILMNDNKCPVICDFGLSKLSNHETTTASVAGLKGTPRCLAPEIFEEKKCDTPIDVFAFAIHAYGLLTNCYPFICKSNWYKSANAKLQITPFTFPDKFEKFYVDLITECSNINPNSRPSFSTIVMKLQNGEFMEDIDREKYENYINSVAE